MSNVKAGIGTAVGTVVLIILELILFPIALTFLSNLNSSSTLSAQDRTTLSSVPTLMIVIVVFTALGGMIGAVYLGIKG